MDDRVTRVQAHLLSQHLLSQLDLGARAVAMRLRLGALVASRSLPDLLSSLTPRRAAPLPLAEALAALAASERVIERLRVIPDTCLYRSLARYALLRRAGHEARFVMALDPRKREIEGHAWVEIAGEPVGEEIEPGLSITFAFPGPLAHKA